MVKLNIPSSLEILKSIPRIKYEWKLKSPKEKWCYMYGLLKNSVNWIKFPVYGHLKKVHWGAHYHITYMMFNNILMFYTFYYYLSRGDLFGCFPCTLANALCTAVVPLMYKVTTENRFKFTSLSVFGGQHIYKDRDYEDAEYNHVCSNYIDMTMRSFLIKTSLMFPSLAASQIGPLFAYISEGLKTTTLCFRIPFTEAGSDAEFIVNLILQFNLCFFGGLGYLGLEVWMSLVENTVLVSPAIFKLKMKRLCEQYKSKSITEFEMRSTFKNLAIQSTDADDYTAEVSDMLYSRTLLTPILFTYVIGMSIFCQFSANFSAGYGIALMTWVQLFYVCELGENIQDNGFAEILYDIEWEVLPLDLQKDIMHLINRKQNVSGIKLGPFGTGINRDVFKVCTNKIYTLVMFLKRFTE